MRSGLEQQQGRDLMHRAIRLAESARSQFDGSAQIALALGPYGAQFGQEYSGYYPPPYGPAGPDDNGEASINTFSVIEEEEEERAKEALVHFHYNRLLVIASDPDIWNIVDCLAFETIPLLREAQAIQRAVALFESYLLERQLPMKPWWLSFVFLKGQFPQDSPSKRRKLMVSELVRGLCNPIGNGILPSGVGVNCTVPNDAIRILKSLMHEFAQYSVPQPWAVLYPNGGHGYDLNTHSWLARGGGETEKEALENWVEEVGAFCRKERSHSRGMLVGGCCKCGPGYVQALRSYFASLDAPSTKENA